MPDAEQEVERLPGATLQTGGREGGSLGGVRARGSGVRCSLCWVKAVVSMTRGMASGTGVVVSSNV